jgi:hypothetical protein
MWKTLARQTPRPVSRLILNQVRKFTVEPFLKKLADASKVQRDWLMNRVRLGEETEFGRDHKYKEIRNLADFRAIVPISKYDYFAPYVQKVAAGETTALIPPSEKLVQFTITTGSTGVPKLNPVSTTWLREYRDVWALWGTKLFTDHPRYIGSDILQMAGSWDMGRTPSKMQISMVSALLARIQHPMIKPYYAIPVILNEIRDPVARHYTALRLCILEDIGWIMLMNPGTLIRLAELADTHKEMLLKDLKDGSLADYFEIPDPIRKALKPQLSKRNDAGVKKLEAIIQRTGRLLPKDYWNQPVITCWLGGTAGFQSRYLVEYFGDSPMRDMGLVSSEGRHTIPLDDTRPEGVPAMGAGFYEFVPLEESSSTHPIALEGHELTVGHDYRLVMTTSAGFYRFDIGDIVRCTGFRGNAPLLEFIQKHERVGDLEGEKVTEHQIIEAAHKAAAKVGRQLGHFTGVPRRLLHEQPRYDFIVEITDLPDAPIAQQFLMEFDRELAALNFLWRARRNEGVLQSPQLLRVAGNTWDQVIQKEVNRRGTGDYQYKHPGLVQDETWIHQFQPIDIISINGNRGIQ